MQQHFNDLMKHANKHKMLINENKSKVMLFNQAHNYDFIPSIETDNGTLLQTVDKIRLLGLVVRSDLGWQDNTDQMYKKAYGRLWMIRNLKKLGVLRNNLLDVIEYSISLFLCIYYYPSLCCEFLCVCNARHLVGAS